MILNDKTIYRIKDTFHPHINKGDSPWIYSNNEAFPTNIDFMQWVNQHTNDLSLVEEAK
jgi:hypothetical protein